MSFHPNNEQRTAIDLCIVGFAMTTGVIMLGMVTAFAIEQREDSQPWKSFPSGDRHFYAHATSVVFAAENPFLKTQISIKLGFHFAVFSPQLHRQLGFE